MMFADNRSIPVKDCDVLIPGAVSTATDARKLSKSMFACFALSAVCPNPCHNSWIVVKPLSTIAFNLAAVIPDLSAPSS